MSGDLISGRTAGEDRLFGGEFWSYLTSLGIHFLVLFLLFVFTFSGKVKENLVLYLPPSEETVQVIEFESEELDVSDSEITESLDTSQEESQLQDVAQEVTLQPIAPVESYALESELGEFSNSDLEVISEAERVSKKDVHRGSASNGVSGATGAVNLIAKKIHGSCMERKTLVIWLFDQSESLKYQRKEIRESFVKVYEDLDNTFGFTKKNLKDKDAVLLTHMYEYGNGLKKLMFKPTRVTKKILNAFDKIQIDDTGVERTFSAVIETVSRNLRFRKPETKGKDEGQYRNIIVVVVTDEVGDDVSRLEASIGLCRKWKIPVYVLGVPAPFGRQTTPFQWVDPDPRFDQTPHWVEVKQGPESLMVERLDFGYFRHFLENEELIDSGFGPFALSRLAVQTGGAYYSVHPNREVKKDNRNSRYTSRMSQFFDSEIMREYQPEYTNFITFQRKVSLNRCRAALLAAAKIRSPRTDYQPRMDFLRTRNQSPESLVKFPLKQVSNRIVQLRAMYKALSVGEADRQNESVKRWQAGYDLAMGRLLTETVRVERYQFVLEWMKKQKGFQNPKNNTWVIETDKDFQPEGRWKQMADKGRAYLERVVKEHPGTPWAYVASNELKQPIGWICRERFTYIAPPRPQAPTASPPPRRDPPKF